MWWLFVATFISAVYAQDYIDYGIPNNNRTTSLPFKIFTRKCCGIGESFYLSSNECGASNLEFVAPVFLTKNSRVLNVTQKNMHIETGVLKTCSPSTMSSNEFLLLDNGELFSSTLNAQIPPSEHCLENTVDEIGGVLTSELIAAYCPMEVQIETYDRHKVPLRKCCSMGEVVASDSLECKFVNDTDPMTFSVEKVGPITMDSAQFHDIFESAPGYPECLSNERGEVLGANWNWVVSNESGNLVIAELGSQTAAYCVDQFDDGSVMAYTCLSEPTHRQYKQMTPSCQDSEDFCVNKCCPYGQLLNEHGQCVADRRKLSKENVFLFSANGSMERVDDVDFEFGFPTCQQRGLFITKMEEKGRLLLNGTLQYISYDPTECNPFVTQIIAKRDFCYDMIEYENFGGVSRALISGALICYPEESDQPYHHQNQINYIYSIFLIISDIFILISFVIYLTVPDQTKRGLNKNVKLGHSILGRILLSFLFSLFFAYLCLIIVKTASEPINLASNTACISVGIIMYIAFLATFFWLNVLCFELWWKCARQERSSGRRWLWYQIYAWGNPLLLGSLVMLIEFYPRIGPCFIKPNFGVQSCFFSETRTFGSAAKWIYLNGPVAVLLVADLLFFVLTVRSLLHTVHQSHKGTIRKQARQRLRLAFKLFLVMGICWLTEIISAAINTKWYVTEVFNCLQGFVIFLIFILKPKILEAVKNRVCSCCCGRIVTDQPLRGRVGFTASSVLFDFFTSTRKRHSTLSSNNPSISSASTNSSALSVIRTGSPLPIPSRLGKHSIIQSSSSHFDSRKPFQTRHMESHRERQTNNNV